MKKYLILLIVVATAACKKENNTPTITVMDRVDTSIIVKYSGHFVNGPYGTVSGKVKVLLKDGEFTLVPDSVTVSNGPDLHVYLSKERLPFHRPWEIKVCYRNTGIRYFRDA